MCECRLRLQHRGIRNALFCQAVIRGRLRHRLALHEDLGPFEGRRRVERLGLGRREVGLSLLNGSRERLLLNNKEQLVLFHRLSVLKGLLV